MEFEIEDEIKNLLEIVLDYKKIQRQCSCVGYKCKWCVVERWAFKLVRTLKTYFYHF
jgi:hypothetical protein